MEVAGVLLHEYTIKKLKIEPSEWEKIFINHISDKCSVYRIEASLVAQMVKRLPAMQETQVRSLGQENLLEKEVAAHSSTVAWKIP